MPQELLFKMEDGQDPNYESDLYLAKNPDNSRFFEADWQEAVETVKSQFDDAEWGENELFAAINELGWSVEKQNVHFVSY